MPDVQKVEAAVSESELFALSPELCREPHRLRPADYFIAAVYRLLIQGADNVPLTDRGGAKPTHAHAGGGIGKPSRLGDSRAPRQSGPKSGGHSISCPCHI